ncbi:hypothetical protein [Actinokineospora inagensis]|nr:hypothetical protein [Actinokineospora inagensis]
MGRANPSGSRSSAASIENNQVFDTGSGVVVHFSTYRRQVIPGTMAM